MEFEKRKRISEEWDKISQQDYLSDEEALKIVAQSAGVTYGEAREVLCAGWPAVSDGFGTRTYSFVGFGGVNAGAGGGGEWRKETGGNPMTKVTLEELEKRHATPSMRETFWVVAACALIIAGIVVWAITHPG